MGWVTRRVPDPTGKYDFVTQRVWVSDAARAGAAGAVASAAATKAAKAAADQARKAAAAKAAEARKRAYEALLERQRAEALRLSRLASVRNAAERRADEVARSTDARDATSDRIAKMNETATGGEVRRAEALKRATTTGDFEGELRRIRAKQVKTGGRYLDADLYKGLIDAFAAKQAQALDAYLGWIEKFKALQDREGHFRDLARARALYESPEFKAAAAEFDRYAGDNGLVARLAPLFDEIAANHEEWKSRAALSTNAAGYAAYVEAGVRKFQGGDVNARRRRGPQDVDRASGSDERVLISLARFQQEAMRNLEERYRRRMQQTLQGQLARRRMLEIEGFDPDTGRAPAADRLFAEIMPLLGADRDKILRQLQTGGPVDQQRAWDAIDRVYVKDLERRYAEQFPRPAGVGYGSQGPTAAVREWERKRAAWVNAQRERLWNELLGVPASRGVERGMAEFMRLPVAGEALKGLQIGGAGIFGLLRRWYLHTGQGRMFGGPDLMEYMAKGIREGKSPAESRAEWEAAQQAYLAEEVPAETEAWNQLVAEFTGATAEGDVPKAFESLIGYSAEPFGNPLANFVIPSILDPLNTVAPAKWFLAGRLAIARQGGAAAALGRGSFRDTVALARRFSANRDALRDSLARSELGQRYGSGVSDAVIAAAERERLFARPDALDAATGRIARQFKVPEPVVKQLFATVMNELDAVGRGMGRKVLSEHDLGLLIREGELRARRAEREAAGVRGQMDLADQVERGRAVVRETRDAKFGGPIEQHAARRAEWAAKEVAERERLAAKWGADDGDLDGALERRIQRAQREDPDTLADAKRIAELSEEHRRVSADTGESVRTAHERNESAWARWRAAKDEHDAARKADLEARRKRGAEGGSVRMTKAERARLDALADVERKALVEAQEAKDLLRGIRKTGDEALGSVRADLDVARAAWREKMARVRTALEEEYRADTVGLREALRQQDRIDRILAGLRASRGDVDAGAVTPEARKARSSLEVEIGRYEALAARAREDTALLADATKHPAQRAGAYERLRETVYELRAYEDEATDQGVIPGRLNAARQAYDEALVASGGRTLAGSPVLSMHVPWKQIDREVLALRDALKEAERLGDTARAADLRAGLDFLARERLRSKGREAVARQLVAAHGDEAAGYIRRNKYVAKVRSAEGAAEEELRDLNVKYRTLPDATESAAMLSDEELETLADLAPRLDHPLDLSDARLESHAQAMSGWSLHKAFVVLSYVAKDPAYEAAWKAVFAQVGRALDGTGVKPGDFLDLMRREHYSAAFSHGRYLGLDADIAARFDARERRVRKGTQDFARRRGAAGDGDAVRTMRLRDANLLDLADKYDATRAVGTTVWAYDEVRPMFRGPMLKRNASEGAWREADEIATREGRSFDEAYEEVYERRAKEEAAHALTRFALDVRYTGAAPESIWAAFLEANTSDDLLPPPRSAGINEWQRGVLRDALEAGGIADPDDLAAVAKTLGGEIRLPEGAVRLLTAEEYPGAQFSIPAIVVPDGDVRLEHVDGSHAAGVHISGDGIYIAESVASGPEAHRTIVHEWAHALEEGPDGPAAMALVAKFGDVADPAKRDLFGNTVMRLYGSGREGDASEFLAELYSTWAAGPNRLTNGSREGLLWSELRAVFPEKAALLDEAEALFPALRPPDKVAYGVRGLNVPPFHSRPALYEWLVANGFWTRRTADEVTIRAGRVWDIDMEREFFEARFGFTPEWTDRAYLMSIRDDPVKWDAAHARWGTIDNGYESRAETAHMSGAELKDATAFGSGEAAGIRKARTPEEQRRWMAARYKDVISPDGGKTLVGAPWLMDPTKPEFDAWVARWVAEQTGQAGVSPTLAADLVRRGEVRLPEGFIRPDEAEAYGKVVARVVRRWVDRDARAGGREVWFSELRYRLAQDIVDELLRTKAWRRLSDRPLAGIALRLLGQAWRLSVMFSAAFAIVNNVERAVFKLPAGQLIHKDVNLLGAVDEDAMLVVHSMEALNVGSTGVWTRRTMSGWEKVTDERLEARARALGLGEAILQLPIRASTIGEGALQLRVARRTYMSFRDSYLARGWDEQLAKVTALHQARRRVIRIFALGEDAGEVEKALNALIPFFSYNVRTGLLALRVAVEHPAVFNVFDRFGRLMEEVNREQWEAEHPDIPWDQVPEADRRRLWIRIGEDTYQIDLGQYSDIIRAGEKTFGPDAPDTVMGWLARWIRVPHPMQQGFLALLTGGDAPWGPVTWTDFVWPADFLASFDRIGEGQKYADWVEMLSGTLTWNKWDRVRPDKIGAYWYWSLLRAKRYDAAEAFLAANPVVAAYLDTYVPAARTRRDGSISLSYFRAHPEARAAFDAGLEGLRALQTSWDERLDAYWRTPWDPALSDLKRQRRFEIDRYILGHPELFDALAHGMSLADWQRQMGEWAIDDGIDLFFSLDAQFRPRKASFDLGTPEGELAYAVAKREYDAWRAAWLAAHPAVEERLAAASNDLARAWKEHEATQAALLATANDLRIQILEAEIGGVTEAEREDLDVLYELSDLVWDAIDGERLAVEYEAFDKEWGTRRRPTARDLVGKIPTAIALPGFDERRLAKLPPAEREKAIAAEARATAYRDGMRAIAERLKAYPKADRGKWFYRLLEADPALMAEYFRRNPDAKARYETGREYARLIGRWGRLMAAKRWDEADRYWSTLPAWVRERYFAKHPEKRLRRARTSAYLGAMGRWVTLLKAKDYDAANRFFRGLPDWMKERYFAKHPEARFTLGRESRMMARAASYFGADDLNRVRLLAEDPELRAFLNRFRSDDIRRALVMAAYRSITDPWMKRVFRERFPEIFSSEAKAADRARSLARKLRAHPELAAAYERAVAYQTAVYEAQARLAGGLPKPLEVEHIASYHRRRRRVRRQAARFNAHWKGHEELRHG